MKPLLMMRTRGLSGPFASKHYGVPRLSKSIGNAAVPIDPAPTWSALPVVSVAQGGNWDIDLNDYVTGSQPMTFFLDSGSLPANVAVLLNGTLNGTVIIASGSGSAKFSATNTNGTVVSGALDWTVPV